MSSFARTKIQPPRVRADALIERPALQARLGQAVLEHRVVLVCAAAGFGKTSLLVRQLERLPAGTAVAWVSCDSDDSPVQLLECLVAALEPHDLPWRTDPAALISAAAQATHREARRAIVAEVINALDACDVPHGVIVVDDLHRVAHGMVYQFLELLLERFTPRWTLVLASREEPPLPLPRLRAAGHLAEFRGADLRFDADETRALAAKAGLGDGAAVALHTRTDGWPVGLRLALDLMRGARNDAASAQRRVDRQVFDFLAAEVLDRMDPQLQGFLLACSVLPELTAARCAAVTGDARAAQRLEAIDRAGLFVTPLDEREPTWRLHDLFRAALEQRLRETQPERVPLLLTRAAASEPDAARRVGFLLQAGDAAAAAAELREHGPPMITGGDAATVMHLLARFSPADRDTLPDLLFAQAILGWARWDWPLMQSAAQRAADGYRRQGHTLRALESQGYELIALRGSSLRQQADEAAAALEQACQQHVDTAGWAPGGLSGNEPGYVALTLLLVAGNWAAFESGRLHDLPPRLQAQMALQDRSTGAEALFRGLPLPLYLGMAGLHAPVLHYAHRVLARTDQIPGELRTLARGLLGGALLWRGELDKALAELQEAAEDVRWRGHPLRLTLYVQTPLNLALALRGDTDALLPAAAQFEAALRRGATLPALAQRAQLELFTLARALLCAGCDERARALLLTVPAQADASDRPLFALQRRALPGYLAWLDCDDAAALAVWEPLLTEAGLDFLGLATELCLRVAQLRLARGDSAASVAPLLLPLFERHAGGADQAALWLAGPGLLQALAQVPWRDALSAVQQRELDGWAQRAAAQRAPAAAVIPTGPPAAAEGAAAPAAATPGLHPALAALSSREREVLARLAAGDTNKLIARAFDLSPHTVKRHVANILDKLALNTRGQAAAWFREHG